MSVVRSSSLRHSEKALMLAILRDLLPRADQRRTTVQGLESSSQNTLSVGEDSDMYAIDQEDDPGENDGSETK